MAGRVPLKIVYLLVRQVLGLAILMFRGDGAKEAELLVLRHENAVLRRYAGRVRYEPGVVRRVGPASSPQALDRYLPRDASNAPGLAPQAGREEVRHQQPTQAWPSANSPEHSSPCCPAGEGESTVGVPPDPRRADETRSDGRAVHGAGDPACCGHRSGAAPVRSDRLMHDGMAERVYALEAKDERTASRNASSLGRGRLRRQPCSKRRSGQACMP